MSAESNKPTSTVYASGHDVNIKALYAPGDEVLWHHFGDSTWYHGTIRQVIARTTYDIKGARKLDVEYEIWPQGEPASKTVRCYEDLIKLA